MKKFDYYIFIDYSEGLIGYMIIENNKISELITKISKFAHYRRIKHRNQYIQSIKKRIKKENMFSCIFKVKIRKLKDNLEIYSDILDFLKKNDNCLIFISVDNKQYISFKKIIDVIDVKNIKIVQESALKKDSKEYQISLVIDTLLNIERLKAKGKGVRQTY